MRNLERLKKYCSHSVKRIGRAVLLVFGFVSAQLQGFANLLLRRSLAKNQKSSLRIGYSIFLTALDVKFDEWRARMIAGGLKSPAVLDELESHLREEIERQTRSGADELKAFELAAQKIGGSDLLKAEFAKIRRCREIPLGKLVGGACCVAAAAYSLVLAPALITVHELGSAQRFLGLGAVFLTLLFLVSLRFSHKFLPVIRNRRARVAAVSACALAGFIWVFVFSNLLPNFIVPRLMAETVSETQTVRPMPGGYASRSDSLQVHNQVLLSDDRLAQPGYTAPSQTMAAVFNIGISLFWAMALAAALGGLAYGLEEAAKRRVREHVYV
jgi:hypothetical protein